MAFGVSSSKRLFVGWVNPRSRHDPGTVKRASHGFEMLQHCIDGIAAQHALFNQQRLQCAYFGCTGGFAILIVIKECGHELSLT